MNTEPLTIPTADDFKALYRQNLAVAQEQFDYLYSAVVVANPEHSFAREDYMIARRLAETMLTARLQFDCLLDRMKQAS